MRTPALTSPDPTPDAPGCPTRGVLTGKDYLTASTGLLTTFAHEVHSRATFLLEEHPDLSWEDAVTAALIDPPSFDWGGESPGDGWRRITGYQLAAEDLPRFRAILDSLDHLEES